MSELSRLGSFSRGRTEGTSKGTEIAPAIAEDGALKATPKDISDHALRQLDQAAADLGFVDRTPRRKPGRKPSPRTFQLHPKVLPLIGNAFADEAIRRDLTQGEFFEIVWNHFVNAGVSSG